MKTHCKNGHEYTEPNTIRLSDGSYKCRQCARDHQRKWREANPDSLREWRKANPERVLEHARKWRKANREKLSAYVRKWREAQRDAKRQEKQAAERLKWEAELEAQGWRRPAK